MHHVREIAPPEALQAHRQIVAGLIGAHQILHDAVELAAARGVCAGHAERRHHALVEDPCERLLVRRLEHGHAGDQLGRGRIRHQVVGDADAVDETALRETALIEGGAQLQRRHDDVAAHRLTVDDRPARLADFLQEELAEGDEVLDEEVGLILARAVARRDPGVTLGENVAPDRRRADRARPWPALDAVGEHDQTAFPLCGRLDEIARAAEHAALADRRAVRCGARAGPRCAYHDEGQAQREEGDEGASRRHPRARVVRGRHRGVLR